MKMQVRSESMRLLDIVSMGMDYIIMGIVALLFVGVIFSLWYFLWFKKKRAGEKLDKRKILFWGLFIIYAVMVLGATMLSRGNYFGNNKIYPLFYSYKDAWNDFSQTEWRNIILNICMFVPLGIFIPLLSKKTEKFWIVFSAGVAITCCIEIFQLVTKRGIFEPDDLLGNTVGTMIGYGIYRLVQYEVRKKKKECREKFIQVVWFQIPILITVLSFACIFLIYYMKELGNLSDSYIIKQKNIEVTSDVSLSDERESVMVYKTDILTTSETMELAERLFEKQGTCLEHKSTDIYENTAVYYSEDGKFSVWVEYKGGTFSYTNYDKVFESQEDKEKGSNLTREELVENLREYGIFLPEENELVSKSENMYLLNVDCIKENGKIYDGSLKCTYYDDGSFGRIEYNIFQLEEYKEFKIISQEEAYKKLQNGEFLYYRKDDSIMDIRVQQVDLVYELDTKGFYQPVYRFEVITGDLWTTIMIPAIE